MSQQTYNTFQQKYIITNGQMINHRKYIHRLIVEKIYTQTDRGKNCLQSKYKYYCHLILKISALFQKLV